MNGFWVYCNDVSQVKPSSVCVNNVRWARYASEINNSSAMLGNSRVMKHIDIVHECWLESRDVRYCAERLWQITPPL
jgi:hypothetical protein